MGEAVATRGLAVARQVRVRWLHAIAASRFTVRTHVLGLILVIVAPLLAFSAYLVLRSATHEQDVMANAVRERTREAAASLDHDLGALRTRLFMLAGSHSLLAGDFAAFREQALDVTRPHGLSLVLSDLAGQELVDTRAEPDQTLPVSTDLEAIRRVVATGEPDVSELTRGAVTGEPFIAVNVPVLRDGRLSYVLSLNIAPMLAAMVAGLDLPAEWLVTIADRAGRTIARSRDAERFVGQMGRPAVLERLRQADEGWLPLVSRDGIPIYNAFAHVRFSGWTVSVGIPDDVLYEPVRRSTRILILAGAVTLAMALFLGVAIGRRIAAAITTLVGYADLVGRGECIVPQDTGIQETDSVAQSLHLAGERLRQSAQERAVLLDRTMIAQEAERKRIARELHDSLGQYLTALRLGFNAIDPFCAANETAQQRLNQLKKLAGDLGRELNRMAWELRPMALDDLGLRRAVIQYLEEWAERSRLQIDMEIGGLDDRRLPQAVETALFRVLQEAITNVVKHSGASRVSVVLEAMHDGVWLTVEDDGRGFDLDSGTNGHDLGVRQLGLLGVRERLALVGGSLDVESSAQSGTTIYVRIPLGMRA
ncbi:MAG: ATP-binding protein [Acetobacteraceae bacterium]